MGTRARTALLAVSAPLLALALVEGCVAIGRLAWLSLGETDALAHTRYDAELGWSHVPGFAAEDFWGLGRPLRINRQGFRGARDVPAEKPAGRVRVVCSGDSFTFGYGVGDPDSWCAQLERADPRLETINMGQQGYGVDQAYLWYLRDGAPLAPDLHVFAFIWDDFLRVVRDRDGKPMVSLVDGEIRVENVPVPRGGEAFGWLERSAPLLDELRSVAMLRRALRGAFGRDAPDWNLGEGARVSFALLKDLAAHHAQRGSSLLLLYLPTREDLSSATFDELRAWLAERAAKRGIAYVDLTQDMRALPPERAAELFLADGEIPQKAGGHYSAAGHRFVAARLRARLEALPGFAASLAAAGARSDRAGGEPQPLREPQR